MWENWGGRHWSGTPSLSLWARAGGLVTLLPPHPLPPPMDTFSVVTLPKQRAKPVTTGWVPAGTRVSFGLLDHDLNI